MPDTPSPAPRRHFPPPPPLVPQGGGLWRRTPPAIFSPLMGLFGLGLAWRVLAAQPGLAPLAPLGEALLGAVLLLGAFALLAYLAKALRRPGVVIEDLALLPGRAGLAALVLSLILAGSALRPYAPGLALGLVLTGLMALVLLGLLIARVLLTGPVEGRTVSPVFHLTYVGYILSPQTLIPLGYTGASTVIFWAAAGVAAVIWALSLRQFVTRIPPAPLRPLLAIHVAPASLLASVAVLLGYPVMGTGFALLALTLVALFILRAGWLLEAGFSPLWGALTFPLAAAAVAALLALGTPGLWIGAGLLALASGLIPYIAYRVYKAWAKGDLAVRTNAATA